jgi:hypothetical protein
MAVSFQEAGIQQITLYGSNLLIKALLPHIYMSTALFFTPAQPWLSLLDGQTFPVIPRKSKSPSS